MQVSFSKFGLVAALALAGAGSAYAHVDTSEGGTLHWIGHVSEAKSAPTANQLAPFGYVATVAHDREISLPSGSTHLNVTRQETVKINVGGKSVVWSFDTLGTPSFPLSKVIPGAEGITVYVAESPSLQGG